MPSGTLERFLALFNELMQLDLEEDSRYLA